MSVVKKSKARYLKGEGSRSYQLITPENVGSKHILFTVVDVQKGGQTAPHRHSTTEAVYYLIRGSGMMTLGDKKFKVGKGTAIHIPPGTLHGIKATGRTGLTYVSVNSPPYDIESLYEKWEKQREHRLLRTGD